MKSTKILALLLLFSFFGYGQNLKMMTYNLRFDNKNDGENWWELRKEFLA